MVRWSAGQGHIQHKRSQFHQNLFILLAQVYLDSVVTIWLRYLLVMPRLENDHISSYHQQHRRLVWGNIVNAITVSVRARSIVRARLDWLEKDMQGG